MKSASIEPKKLFWYCNTCKKTLDSKEGHGCPEKKIYEFTVTNGPKEK